MDISVGVLRFGHAALPRFAQLVWVAERVVLSRQFSGPGRLSDRRVRLRRDRHRGSIQRALGYCLSMRHCSGCHRDVRRIPGVVKTSPECRRLRPLCCIELEIRMGGGLCASDGWSSPPLVLLGGCIGSACWRNSRVPGIRRERRVRSSRLSTVSRLEEPRPARLHEGDWVCRRPDDAGRAKSPYRSLLRHPRGLLTTGFIHDVR